MDFLSTSRGGKFDDAKQPNVGAAAYPYTGPSGYECMPQYISDERGPFGRNATPTATIRERRPRAPASTTPVVCTGGIHNFEMAEADAGRRRLRHRRRGAAIARRSGLVPKDALGLGAEVRVCEYTNYCEGLDQKHKPVTCKLWDKLPFEDGERRTRDGKRRLTAPFWQPPGHASAVHRACDKFDTTVYIFGR